LARGKQDIKQCNVCKRIREAGLSSAGFSLRNFGLAMTRNLRL